MEPNRPLATVEWHPLEPFLPANAHLLMLGSFPPSKRRWRMDFFYPNYNNDMWRIFGLVFFNDRDHFIDTENKAFRKEQIVSFLKERGIALYDTACAVIRTKNTASDKDLEIVRQTDIEAMLRNIPHCATIIATGQKAADVVAEHFGLEPPQVGFPARFRFNGHTLRFWRMPSSSRAYPMPLEEKAAIYKPALLGS